MIAKMLWDGVFPHCVIRVSIAVHWPMESKHRLGGAGGVN